MKKHFIVMIASTFFGVVGIIITIISLLKINSNLDNNWCIVMVVGALFTLVGGFKGYITACHIDDIKKVNSMLKTLKYSENEIEERQKYLTLLSESKLEKLKNKLTYEINKINEDKFFDPLNKNI